MTSLKYNGGELPGEIVEKLISEAEGLNVPPSYLITKLHYEGLWGKSEVARANNNWAGMTWLDSMADGRPSGVKVTRGSARPADEGGYYIKYASIDDFFKDWLYLIRRGGIYKVADSATFDEAVKGMFICGGAKYDYATMNIEGDNLEVSQKRFEAYLKGMRARRNAINEQNKGVLDDLDRKEGKTMAESANVVLAKAREEIGTTQGSARHKRIIDDYNSKRPLPRGYAVNTGDDWCDIFVTVMADRAGATSLIGRECGVEHHKNIFKNKGIWLGLQKPQAGDIVIFRWDGNRNGWASHIGFVEKIEGNTITTIEGNTMVAGASRVGRRTYSWNASVIQGYARPKYGTSVPSAKKSNVQVAEEVKLGKWGNGSERKQRLVNAGYDYNAIQAIVNQGGRKSEEKIADEVLAGKHGNNPERIDNLTKLGYDPAKIQAIVNSKLGSRATENVQIAEKQQVGGDEIKLAENEYLGHDGRIWVVTEKK